jgi:hypothetical protein
MSVTAVRTTSSVEIVDGRPRRFEAALTGSPYPRVLAQDVPLPSFVYAVIVSVMSLSAPANTSPSQFEQFGLWIAHGWRAALRHFPALVLIALIADLPLTFIRIAAGDVANPVVSTLITLGAIALVTPFAKAAAIVAIDRWDRGEPHAVLAGIGVLLRRFPLLLAASLLWTISVFAGVALLVVPGIIVLILGQCLMGAITLEGRSLGSAIRRSIALVRPRFFAVLALFAVVQLCAGVISGLLEAVLGLILDGWVLSLLSSCLSSPFAFAPLAAMFLLSRSRDDGHPEGQGPGAAT